MLPKAVALAALVVLAPSAIGWLLPVTPMWELVLAPTWKLIVVPEASGFPARSVMPEPAAGSDS